MVKEEICRNAIKKWGESAQLDMVIEEMAELTKAILKYKRATIQDVPFYISNIADEYADVSIMLDQLFVLMSDKKQNFPELVKQSTLKKVVRLTNRLMEK